MKVFYLFIFLLIVTHLFAQESVSEGVRIQAKFAFEIKTDPSPLAESIVKGKAGDPVKIIATSKPGYYYVDYNGQLGYIHGVYLVSPDEQESFNVELSEKLNLKKSAKDMISIINSVENEEIPEEKLKKEENSKSFNPDDAIQRSYDEFTGETLITAEINGPISFVKTISETGKDFAILKWESFSRNEPDKKHLELIILFDDNTRLSMNLPIVSKYNEFWTSINLKVAIETETVMDPTMYSLRSEVILTPSQIAMLRSKTIKKYRLEGYSAHEIYDRDADSKIIFNKLLNTK